MSNPRDDATAKVLVISVGVAIIVASAVAVYRATLPAKDPPPPDPQIARLVEESHRRVAAGKERRLREMHEIAALHPEGGDIATYEDAFFLGADILILALQDNQVAIELSRTAWLAAERSSVRTGWLRLLDLADANPNDPRVREALAELRAARRADGEP